MAPYYTGQNCRQRAQQKRRTTKIREAHRRVVAAFQNLQHAWLLQQHPLRDIPSDVVRQFERKAWDRLMRDLVRLPTPRD
jgi:hypothetical protein